MTDERRPTSTERQWAEVEARRKARLEPEEETDKVETPPRRHRSINGTDTRDGSGLAPTKSATDRQVEALLRGRTT